MPAMTTRLTAAGFATAILHWGLHCPWWIAIGASALGVWFIFGNPSGAGKTIFVMDQATGQMTPQPMDRAGERYLSTRKDNDG